MLADRFYMREKPAGPKTPSFTLWMLGVLTGVFVLQSVLGTWFGSRVLEEFGVLSSRSFRAGHVWNVLTYALLHGYTLHLLLNALGLFFIGRRLEERYGPGKLTALAVASAIGGAVLWLALHFNDIGTVAGSSGVLMGFVTVFVCLAPREPLWIIPAPRFWLLIFFIGIDLLGLLFRELPRGIAATPVSHSAHLGGALAGWLFYRLVLARHPLLATSSAVEAPAWSRKPAARAKPAYTVNLSPPVASPAPVSREALRAEVDRILDKINLHGFGSLTDREKRSLDEARQTLNPR